ncbi:MAG: hypothetical protein FJ399_02200 [Verrucomicrobia bacterium]|nr:hypothetical protein [Verrucomicrobiota bacterium]
MPTLGSLVPHRLFPAALVLGVWAGFTGAPIGAAPAPTLEAGFAAPPAASRPYTFWHWMNGHISRDGITRDLEAMRTAGLGGFLLWNTAEGTPPGPVKYMSPEWWHLLEHTFAEADRLSLKMGMHNCAGWSSSGGPWVTPDRSMQEVVWTETSVSGPGKIEQLLTIPEPALGIERDMKKDPKVNRRYYVDREQVRGYYRDIAVFAFPTLRGDAAGKPFRLAEWRLKAGFGKLRDRQPLDPRPLPAGDAIDPGGMIDLSDKLDRDGRLRWQAPPGQWTILRLGYQPTGRQNHPAPVEGRGLEISKLSAAAADFFWEQSIAKFIQAAGPRTGKVFTYLEVDSFEVGHQNWSETLAGDFRRLRGYDLRRHLPALTGRIVGDVAATERFLWDFRKTIGDLIAENYFGRFAARCREHGLLFASEPYGNYGNADDFTVAGHADIPTCEWWAGQYTPHHTATAKLAASAAHTYGRPIVDAEAFTGNPARIFEEYPANMKAQGDYMFCQGINRFSFHTFAHDPYGVPPGLGLGTYGGRFDSRNTWWLQGQPWREYLARCQHLLQQGQFVADLLYYAGEDAPQWCRTRDELDPKPPAGLDFDFCNREILGRLRVDGGTLLAPGGILYRLLVLPPVTHMRPATLRTIAALVADGAIVVGPKPVRVPGLEGGDSAARALRELADRVWGDCDGKSVTTHTHGRGRVYWGRPLDDICRELHLTPDFQFETSSATPLGKTLYPGAGTEFIHRRIGEVDVYFISNQHDQAKTVRASFRVTNRLPELWQPESGRIEVGPEFEPTADGRMRVTLRLDAAGSVFVVFRRPLGREAGVVAIQHNNQPASARLRREEGRLFLRAPAAGEFLVQTTGGQTRRAVVPALPAPRALAGPWSVAFPAGQGAPETITLPQLASWTDHEHPEVRHFSGTATYRFETEVPGDWLAGGRRVQLDLGEVQVIAELKVNDVPVAVLWKAPYAVDATAALRPGRNRIEIRVTSLWVNRLVGDLRHPDDNEWTSETGSTAPGQGLVKIPDWVVQHTPRPSPERRAFVAWRWLHLPKKSLLPSGLIGPVRLVPEAEVLVE